MPGRAVAALTSIGVAGGPGWGRGAVPSRIDPRHQPKLDLPPLRGYTGLVQRLLELMPVMLQKGQGLAAFDRDAHLRWTEFRPVHANLHLSEIGRIEAQGQMLRACPGAAQGKQGRGNLTDRRGRL